MVHGTAQGASILFRTILDEVFNDKEHHHYVSLRDDKTIADLQKYSDVYEYYRGQFEAPKGIRFRNITGVGVILDETAEFDHGPARDHLLSANLGFFGQCSWLLHGYKESSAEFVTRRCSLAAQFCDVLVGCCMSALLPIFFAGYKVIKNPERAKDPMRMIEELGNSCANEYAFENIFKAHGLEAYYSEYAHELEDMEFTAGAGLVHLFIPNKIAKRWCYLSTQRGIMARSNPEAICASDDTNCQAQVLLHPEVCNPENMFMKFYLLGEPDEISAMITRMYEMAYELKDGQSM